MAGCGWGWGGRRGLWCADEARSWRHRGGPSGLALPSCRASSCQGAGVTLPARTAASRICQIRIKRLNLLLHANRRPIAPRCTLGCPVTRPSCLTRFPQRSRGCQINPCWSRRTTSDWSTPPATWTAERCAAMVAAVAVVLRRASKQISAGSLLAGPDARLGCIHACACHLTHNFWLQRARAPHTLCEQVWRLLERGGRGVFKPDGFFGYASSSHRRVGVHGAAAGAGLRALVAVRSTDSPARLTFGPVW